MAACAHQPAPAPVLPEVPSAWLHAAAVAPEAASPSAAAALPAAWWRLYQQPALDAAVAHALSHSGNLSSALLKLRNANLQAEAAGAALYPTPSGSLSAHVSRPLSGADRSSTRRHGSNLGASWEIDWWGKLATQADMAGFERQASALDHDQAAATLAASVVRQYWQLAALAQRVQLSALSLEHARHTQALAQAQYTAGAISGLALAQSQQAVQAQTLALTALQQQQREMQHALNVLLDVPPGPLPAGLQAPKRLPADVARLAAAAQPGAGLPAQLLARRPDLRAAEWRLRRSLANVQAQRLAFYPSFSLTAALGTGSSALRQFLSNPVASLGAGLSLPFLQLGELRRQPQMAQNEYEQALIGFRQSLLQALADVENALSASATQRQAVQEQAALLAQARRVEALSEVRWRAGAVPLKDWLDAQESRRQAELAEVSAQLDWLLAQAQLYQALGAATGAEVASDTDAGTDALP